MLQCHKVLEEGPGCTRTKVMKRAVTMKESCQNKKNRIQKPNLPKQNNLKEHRTGKAETYCAAMASLLCAGWLMIPTIAMIEKMSSSWARVAG